MFKKTLITVFVALLALAIPAGASAADGGAVVFSKVTEDHRLESEGKVLPPKAPEGGLFAVKDGHLNQLTENPADSEPSFSPDGHTIAFAREGDLFSIRPDGSGQRQLTSGAELDSRPLVSPNGRYVVFERRAAARRRRRPLHGQRHTAAAPHALDHRPATSTKPRSRPTAGRSSSSAPPSAPAAASTTTSTRCRPTGAGLRRLTRTAGSTSSRPLLRRRHRLQPRREQRRPGRLRRRLHDGRNGQHVQPQVIAGAGSAYVEDVTADGRTLLFRRDQGLWVKQIGRQGPQAHRSARQLEDQHRLLLRRQAGRRLHRNRRRRTVALGDQRRHRPQQLRRSRRLHRRRSDARRSAR